jgi:hypothetical protein
MDKLAVILDAARTLSPDERRRLIVELDAPEAVEHSGVPASREPLAALRALSGMAHYKLPILLDKIAAGLRDAPALSDEAVSRAGIYVEDLNDLDLARSRRVEQEALDLLDEPVTKVRRRR